MWFPIQFEKTKISNFIGCFCVRDKFLGQKTERAVYCLDTEGLIKVSAQSEWWFPIHPPKKWVDFFWAGEKVKISNFIGLFCLKDKLVGQKTDTASLLSWHWRAMKSFSKIWIVFSNSAYPKMVKFLQAGEKVKISNFIGWFCLKDKLLEQNFDTAVYCPDTERLWKFSAKSESWFLMQPTEKWWNFFEQARRSKFKNSSVDFV